LAVNLSTYGATQSECDCSNNWSVADGGYAGACLTEPGAAADVVETQAYEAICPDDQRVQWGFLAYDTNVPSNDAGQGNITVQVHVADDPADLLPDCSDCVTLADIPGVQPEDCPMIGGAVGCPIDLYSALSGTPEAHRSVLELVFTVSASPQGGPSIFFEEDFSNNSQGWTLDTEWALGAAAASSGHNYGNADPNRDAAGTVGGGVAGVNIGGNASTAIHGYRYLTSPVIFLDVTEDVTLSYARWLNSDYTPFMQNTVEVYNGSSWVTLWSTAGSPGVQDNAWQPMTHDVSAYKNPDFRVRFGFQVGSSGVFTVGSWNVDDVMLYAEDSTQAMPLVVDWEITHSCVDAQ
jgi:hypothetical protein